MIADVLQALTRDRSTAPSKRSIRTELAPLLFREALAEFVTLYSALSTTNANDLAFLSGATMRGLPVLLAAVITGFGVGATITINHAPALTDDSRNGYYFAEEPVLLPFWR